MNRREARVGETKRKTKQKINPEKKNKKKLLREQIVLLDVINLIRLSIFEISVSLRTTTGSTVAVLPASSDDRLRHAAGISRHRLPIVLQRNLSAIR